MRMTTVNEDALLQAATFVVGAQATNAIMQLYWLLDTAQKGAFELGRQVEAEKTEQALDDAFDNGWGFGKLEGEAEAQVEIEARLEEASDNGYISGVADARARPAVADSNVQDIINLLAQNAINGEYIDEEDADEPWARGEPLDQDEA